MEKTLKKFFLASNSFCGFVSHFEDNYFGEEAYKAYIIKGGPGTGKSSLMKYIAKKALDKGEDVELCPCSSDPDSLDGVILKERKTIILDGTSPHTVEPKYPGVCEEIINLGEFWDSEKLEKNRLPIINTTNLNKALHKTAALYFATCGELQTDTFNIESKAINREKVLLFAKKVAEKYIIAKKDGKSKEYIKFLEGITPKGVIGFSKTVTDYYETVIAVNDRVGAVSNIFMNCIRQYALDSGYETVTVKNAFLPSICDHILIPELSLAFVTNGEFIKFEKPTKTIRTRQFKDKEQLSQSQSRINLNNKIKTELLQSGINSLSKAKKVHDVLEKYYIDAMDFNSLTAFAEKLSNRIFAK